jgi:1-deoxy-D-xylulose-5-phosphate reductoisomerase
MVEYVDGTILAQLSVPDMRGPIAFALSCPERLQSIMQGLDLIQYGTLTFSAPDGIRFPNLGLAYGALSEGGLMPAVMNAANEIAVQKFCDKQLPFNKMPVLIEAVMGRFDNAPEVTLDNILLADEWARQESHRVLNQLS